MNKPFAAAGLGAVAAGLAMGVGACGGGSPASAVAPDAGSAPATPTAVTAQDVAASVIGNTITSAAYPTVVHADTPISVVTTDPAGDSSVQVSGELYWAPAGTSPANSDYGSFTGTATLYANGDSYITIVTKQP